MSASPGDAGGRPETVRGLLEVASRWLTEQGVEEARLDTELLLAHALGCRRLDLYLDHDRPLAREERERFRALMRRRGAREPVAYILAQRGFYGLDLEVSPAVLVPRPETEQLVEAALVEADRLAAEGRAARFVDVGTGSGAVALALARERPALVGVATDVSPAALRVAARNARQAGVRERLALLRADLLAPFAPGCVDLVVSNPPYVTPDEEGLLAPELSHEPRLALFDDAGLPLTRRLVAEARRCLRPGGALAVETGFARADLVAGYFAAAGFVEVRRVEDLGGVERVICGRTPA